MDLTTELEQITEQFRNAILAKTVDWFVEEFQDNWITCDGSRAPEMVAAFAAKGLSPSELCYATLFLLEHFLQTGVIVATLNDRPLVQDEQFFAHEHFYCGFAAKNDDTEEPTLHLRIVE